MSKKVMAFFNSKRIVALFLLISVGLTTAIFASSVQDAVGTGMIFGKYSLEWLGVLIVEFVTGVFCLILLFASLFRFNFLQQKFNQIVAEYLRPFKWLNLAFVVAVSIIIIWAVFYFQPDRLNNPLSKWWLLWIGALLCTPFLLGTRSELKWYEAFVAAIIIMGSMQAMSLYFLQISNYPFSFGWSEASRYYYASLFFSRQIYGHTWPLPVLHPSRYFLQSIPFIFPDGNILLHRIWQALLWVVIPAISSWLLTRRLKLLSVFMTCIVSLFIFLFFFQGPIYYHLIIMAIPILAGYSPNKPVRNLILVLLASAWAGVSRVNWWPLPGVLTVLLFILETPFRRNFQKSWLSNIVQFYFWPVVWIVAGFLTAYFTNHLYEGLSGNPREVFGSALNSPLLWYRLWPNVTYGPGILLMAFLVFVFPALIIVFRLLEGPQWHWSRLVGLSGILLAFFLGGVLVSVKIGGGSNLHNMDTFLLLICVVLLYVIFNRFVPDNPLSHHRVPSTHLILSFIVVMITIGQVIYYSEPEMLPNAMKTNDTLLPSKEKTTKALDLIRHQIATADQEGEVLFLTQKHLITFGDIDPKNYDMRYEKVFLMEMAMANNQDYLQSLYQDLQNHRFSLIITERLSATHQSSSHVFSEENNAWVDRVAIPILDYYQKVDGLPEFNIFFYKPKE